MPPSIEWIRPWDCLLALLATEHLSFLLEHEAEIETLGQTLQAAFWVENWRNSKQASGFP